MSALANHPFSKMNGIGNEIVVVDLRESKAPASKASTSKVSTSKPLVTPDEARAVASAVP